MFLKKEGFPEENELLLVTITGINPHGVFVTLDEYGGRTGMIHISEIAPGRIRNIREYVQEGKKIVTKVLQINQERGHIDLSLRRVNESQRRNKLNSLKQEQVAEKIIEQIAKQFKKKPVDLYKKILDGVKDSYDNAYEAFEGVVAEELDLASVVDKDVAKALTEVIKQRIKPMEVTIGGDLTLTTYSATGIHEVKEALEFLTKGGVEVRYLGAGAYHVQITAPDYKHAEKQLKTALDKTLKYAEKHDMVSNFVRKEIEV